MTRRLAAKTRLVFDYLLMTKNSTGHAAAAQIGDNEFAVANRR
jgi:hypothetical protein